MQPFFSLYKITVLLSEPTKHSDFVSSDRFLGHPMSVETLLKVRGQLIILIIHFLVLFLL